MSKFKGDEEFFNPKQFKEAQVRETKDIFKQLERQAQESKDMVNQPAHYKDGGIEVIDFIEAKKLGYNLGNVVKYVSRAGKKGGPGKELEDLKKAAWYLAREIHALGEKG